MSINDINLLTVSAELSSQYLNSFKKIHSTFLEISM